MCTTRPSVLTMSPTHFMLQPIVVESTTSSSEIKNAIRATRRPQCHSRSVRRQTRHVPFAMIASAVSSLLQVKNPPTPTHINIRSKNERVTCVKLYWPCLHRIQPFFLDLLFRTALSCSHSRWSHRERQQITDRRRHSLFT